MADLLLSIVIPTHNRADLLPIALASAARQTVDGESSAVEVVVVDDASDPPARLPDGFANDPRVRLIRRSANVGLPAARNAGAAVARGAYLAFLDDDDELLAEFAEASIAALRSDDATRWPSPVAVVSGIEVIERPNDGGSVRVRDVRLPPTVRPRGGAWFLDPPDSGRSYHTKQTLVVPREVFEGLGGYDEAFRSRQSTELFLRLNSACTIVGLDRVTYRLVVHPGPRISRDPAKRQRFFRLLVEKHRDLLESRPTGYAEFLLAHARNSLREGQRASAARAVLEAARRDPKRVLYGLRRAVGSVAGR